MRSSFRYRARRTGARLPRNRRLKASRPARGEVTTTDPKPHLHSAAFRGVAARYKHCPPTARMDARSTVPVDDANTIVSPAGWTPWRSPCTEVSNERAR